MMIISVDGGRFSNEPPLSGSWHIGETMRIPDGQVITFKADGHELTALVEMIRAYGVNVVWPSPRLTPIY